MPLPATSELTDHLGFWLRAVSNHVSQAFAASLATTGVTVAEWVMMRVLYGVPPMAPSRLAETMGMTRGAITKLANRLIAKALVARMASPDDARAQTLALTQAGEALVPKLAAIADRNDADCFGNLSEADRAALNRLLRHLTEQARITAPPLN